MKKMQFLSLVSVLLLTACGNDAAAPAADVAMVDKPAEVAGKPGGPSSWELRLDGAWDFLRDDPRFAALVENGAAEH